VTMESNGEYNQRRSDNLMNIVAVVYGVAITIALSMNPDALLHPVSAAELFPSLGLLAAVLLTAFSFYSYVLAIGGDKPYNIAWTCVSAKWYGLIRFVVDLVLAGLYVHLLFTAVDIEAGPKTKPELAGFMFAFVLVFAGAVLVRLVRRGKLSMVALIAMVVSGLLWWFWVRGSVATRGTDLAVEVILLVGVLLYSGLYQWFAYREWKNARQPTLKLVIYRPAATADKDKFSQRLADLRRDEADAVLIQAWSLDQDDRGLQGAALILDVRTGASLGASRSAEKNLIDAEVIPLQKPKF
jgi:hypothetical protein